MLHGRGILISDQNGKRPQNDLEITCHYEKVEENSALVHGICSQAIAFMLSLPCKADQNQNRQPTLRLLCISDAPTLIRLLGPTHAYASTIHSYHTLVSSVCRHMLTSSCESSGK